MNVMALPFEGFPATHREKWSAGGEKGVGYVGSEPTSVLDAKRSPSPPTSCSTRSSSLGGGGGGGGGSTDTSAAVAVVSRNHSQTGLDIGGGVGKCGPGMEDWDSVLSESAAVSPSQEQSILRMIMADIDDPSVGFNKLLQSAGISQDMEFNGGFGSMDQGLGFEAIATGNLVSNIDPLDFSVYGNQNLVPVSYYPGLFNQQQEQSIVDEKPMIFNPQMVINQHHAQFAQNPPFSLQLQHIHMQEHHPFPQPPSKRLNFGANGLNQVQKVPFLDSGQELCVKQQQQHVQLLPPGFQQRATMVMNQKVESVVGDDLGNHQLQQAILDQLFKSAELIETGNTLLAQGILARLNHQLSPTGKPLQRATYYFKEALQSLLHMNTTTNTLACFPFGLIFKIGAYKSFSEISPILQFANFTCNQAILEALEGNNRVHILDFDVGYGEHWASLMQELALRSGGTPSVKVTAFASPSSCDELELGFAQENLKVFASEFNMEFEFEIVNIDSLSSTSLPLAFHASENVGIAVNLPISAFSTCPQSFPLALRFIKQMKPKIVVSMDRGCDRTDVPFPQHIIYALQSYSNLLESIDAVNINLDALQKIERFLLQPGIEKIVMGRHRSPERTRPWRSLFLSSGFTPLKFSNTTESQAECLVQRTPAMGFHVEKRQLSLVLCWQGWELISAAAWSC